MNIDFAELAKLRASRKTTSPTQSRNKNDDKQVLITDVIGVDEDYNPAEIYELIDEDEEGLTISGVERLFDIDEYDEDNKIHKKYYDYVSKLIENIKDTYKEEMEMLSQRKQKSKQKQREQKIDNFVKEVLPYKLIIDAQHFNARKNKDFNNSMAFMNFDNILITKNKKIENECLLSMDLYDQIISSNIFQQLADAQGIYPYFVVRNRNGIVISIRINQQQSSGNNSLEVPENVYLFLSDISIEDLQLKVRVPTKVDVFLFTQPQIGSVLFRSIGDCKEIKINIEDLSKLIDNNYYTLYLGQKINYPKCNLVVAQLMDESDNLITFGSTYKKGVEVSVKLDLVMEKQDLYKLDKAWDKY